MIITRGYHSGPGEGSIPAFSVISHMCLLIVRGIDFNSLSHRLQVINSQKDGVFSPACFMHAFSRSSDNLTNTDQTLSCEIGGKLRT